MNKNTIPQPRPPLESLACVNERCEVYGQPGEGNLRVRKVYGHDRIRYLRCGCCGEEFSERKRTALWNTKVTEAKAEAVAEHLAEGCSLNATARLVKVNVSVVQRLKRKTGIQAKAFHDERVHSLEVVALEADERHGYAHDKQQLVWEAEVIDPASKFVVSHEQGVRDEALIRPLLEDAAGRLSDRQRLVLLTDGEASYASLFPEIFGQAYRPARRGERGRLPAVRYRIPRTLAHVQIVKHRVGSRVVAVEIRYPHGSKRCVQRALASLGYAVPNTSAVERRNGTARRMSAHQVRRSLAFAHRPDTKLDLGGWGLTVYNWSRPNRALRAPLPLPTDKKSLNNAPRPWLFFSPTVFGQSVTCFLPPFVPYPIRDNLT